MKRLKKREIEPSIGEVVVAVSGGFDPLHVGHLRMIEEAKRMGDKLVVILNNDNWLKNKKGFVFMPQNDRKEILLGLKYVDDVLISFHEKDPQDASVCAELEVLKPSIFCNGGDRTAKNVPEVDTCKEQNIKMVWNVGGGKVASSSDMVKKAVGPR
jgi:D-beta-D-heptose 7-phosphate kinase/D-beta-D-heptose 1-phosphate adenosyltransferase